MTTQMTEITPRKPGHRRQSLEERRNSLVGRWAIAYGIDPDGVKRSFPIRIDDRALNSFPRDLVNKGKLEQPAKRAEWVTDQRFDYYDGKKICEGIFFRHCKL